MPFFGVLTADFGNFLQAANPRGFGVGLGCPVLSGYPFSWHELIFSFTSKPSIMTPLQKQSLKKRGVILVY